MTAATGVPRPNIFVGATHTHAGPDLQGLWGGVTAEYKQVVVDGTVAAIAEAYARREAAQLFVSKGVGSANNRRDWGYTDDELTVLDARSASTGERLGTVIQFAVPYRNNRPKKRVRKGKGWLGSVVKNKFTLAKMKEGTIDESQAIGLGTLV